jgi:hypothetical protein
MAGRIQPNLEPFSPMKRLIQGDGRPENRVLKFEHVAVAAALLLAQTPSSFAQSVIMSETTQVRLSVSIGADDRLTLKALVTTSSGVGVPGGTVRFVDETTLNVLGWAKVTAPGIVVDELGPGPHRLRADYSGTMDFLPLMVQPSQSAVVAHYVRGASDVSVSSSINPCTPGAVVTLRAVITGDDGPPTGAVTFRDGDLVLASHVGLDRTGAASFTTSALSQGARSIVAEYEGDGNNAPASSPQLLQQVGIAQMQISLD